MSSISFFDLSIWVVLAFIFIAGVVDAIAGGGGLISVPILMMTFPMAAMPTIIGTNRFSSFLGTLTAAWQYNKNEKVNLKIIFFAGIPGAIMAALGAWCSHFMPSHYFKPIVIIILLAVILFSIFKRDFGNKMVNGIQNPALLPAMCMGLILGFYNGLVGPGTGLFLLFSLVTFVGFNLVQASATAKLLNVIVDMASLVYFLIAGAIVFKLAIPMALCNILGGYFGSKMAIAKGNQFIKYFFLVVAFILVLKLLLDMIQMHLFFS